MIIYPRWRPEFEFAKRLAARRFTETAENGAAGRNGPWKAT